MHTDLIPAGLSSDGEQGVEWLALKAAACKVHSAVLRKFTYKEWDQYTRRYKSREAGQFMGVSEVAKAGMLEALHSAAIVLLQMPFH